jgi:TP901 family phage tail tape measure protein
VPLFSQTFSLQIYNNFKLNDMANGVSKLQLLIDLRNRIGAGLNTARRQVERATGAMQSRLDAFRTSNVQLFDAIEERVPGASSALGMLKNPYVLIAAAAIGAMLAIAKFTNMANDWHVGLAEINVTASMTQKELGGLSDKLLEIGSRNVAPLEEVPKAFNRIISAGLSVNASLKALEPTLRASKAGFTDIETTAMAAVSVMNSSGRDVNEVYDVLFQTVKAGNANFKDIAQYLPKIIPMARNAGFALGETAGAWAFLTAQGQTSERATTLSENAFKSLADPNKIKAFKQMGISLYDAKGKIKPLINIIDMLNKKTAGLSDLSRAKFYGHLGLDTEAASFFATATQDAGKLRSYIDDVTNSQGALGRAYTDSLTPFESWKIVQNALKGEMIKIGEIFLPIVTQIGEKVLGLINWFKELYKTNALFRDSLAVLGTVFAVTFKIALAPITAIWNMFKTIGSVIGWIVEQISGLIGRITGVSGSFSGLYNSIRPYLMWISEMISQIGGLLYNIATLNFKGIKDGLSNFKMPDLNEIRAKIKVDSTASGDFAGVPNDSTTPKPNTKTPGVVDAQAIGSGSHTKSITINIDSFVKGFNPTSQSINGMNKDELERWMTEMFMRVVRSAETAI